MKRLYPFESPIIFARVLLKAIVLLLTVNFICVICNFDPLLALMKINIAGLIGHGRARLVYPADTSNGQLPLESLFAAHTLAYSPKLPNEFRVLLIGASGVNGVYLPDDETLAGQLTARGININGKSVVVYNLGYPGPNVVKESLIFSEALEYQPDLVIFFVTQASFYNGKFNPLDPLLTFFNLNRGQLKQITDTYGLQHWYDQHFAGNSFWDTWLSFHNQEALPVWLRSLFYPVTTYTLVWTGPRIIDTPIPEKPVYFKGMHGFDQMPAENWQFLLVDQALAEKSGTKLLFVNDPMMIGEGKNYSPVYQRSFYDEYHTAVNAYMQDNGLWYVDLWNLIPAKYFSDTVYHYDAAGAELLSEKLIQVISQSQHLEHVSATLFQRKYLPLPAQSLFYRFNNAPPAAGWTTSGDDKAWMNGTTSALDVSLDQDTPYQISFRVAQSMQPDILKSLQLEVNDQTIDLRPQEDGAAMLFYGLIPQHVMSLGFENTHLTFHVNRVVTPISLGLNEDERTLGLMFDWLKLMPDAPTHSVRFEFDQPASGSGWWPVESSSMWMREPNADLNFNLASDQDYSVKFRVLMALHPDILDSLRLTVDGIPVDLHRATDPQGGTIFSGVIPHAIVSSGNTQFMFTVNRVVTPKSAGINDDERTLGVMFDWLQIEAIAF